jgi:TfoX/Sxy family transcriptional regulator of competence genes
MAYNQELARRIREAVEAAVGALDDCREITMFGGLCWTVNTHMVVGAINDDLMVHVGSDGVQEAVQQGARRATMGQRTMGGVVLVEADDLPDAQSLEAWVRPAVDRARAKPAKKAQSGPR